VLVPQARPRCQAPARRTSLVVAWAALVCAHLRRNSSLAPSCVAPHAARVAAPVSQLPAARPALPHLCALRHPRVAATGAHLAPLRTPRAAPPTVLPGLAQRWAGLTQLGLPRPGLQDVPDNTCVGSITSFRAAAGIIQTLPEVLLQYGQLRPTFDDRWAAAASACPGDPFTLQFSNPAMDSIIQLPFTVEIGGEKVTFREAADIARYVDGKSCPHCKHLKTHQQAGHFCPHSLVSSAPVVHMRGTSPLSDRFPFNWALGVSQ